ncbi:MAG: CAP domain-containing protein [Myxococcales bacterium]|nr:CAP domain-containing protein [Myxococcales bacterium]
MLLACLSMLPAHAGYGDPVDGRPNHPERELHLWTNAVRVDPVAFEDDYPCGMGDFTAIERSPQVPLHLNDDLAEAARFHTDDMHVNDFFSHTSSDGTKFGPRVWSYYSGSGIGENIAGGQGSVYAAVTRAWMCSEGHRRNLMSPDWNELGTGVIDRLYTQDFGRGSPPPRITFMGVHLPRDPSTEVELLLDYAADAPPDALYVVLDGERHDLELLVGSDRQGVYSVIAPAGSGCMLYHFVAEVDGTTEVWPEDGSYGYGSCTFDDDEAGWVAEQLEVTSIVGGTNPGDPTNPTAGGDPDDPDSSGETLLEEQLAGCGCQSGTAPMTAGWVALGLLALRRRRT